MKLIKLYIIVLGTILFTSNVHSQSAERVGDWCGSAYKDAEMKLNNPDLIQQEEQLWKELRTYIDKHSQNKSGLKSSPYIIPLVFHCITDDGAGWVSKADIDDAVLTLNEDFNRTNSDRRNTRNQFLGVVGSTNIQFRLAHNDPNGKCTRGIVRADSPLSTNATDAVKAVSRWNPNDYLNIWVVNSIGALSNGGGTILGYAYKPNFGVSNNVFGIVMNHAYIGRSYRTLTHEVGHSFGLSHTFGGGCGSDCRNSGDRLCDTPPCENLSQGCNLTKDECFNDHTGAQNIWGGSGDVVNQIENYMSYDNCQNMFTKEQITLMEAYLNSSNNFYGLSRLTNSLNWDQTGVNDPYGPVDCSPISNFNYDKEYVCEGASVTFSDDSYDGIPNAWDWTFIGGTPSTSALQSPSTIYNTAGTYSVSYQPSSTGGLGTSITKTGIITVSSLMADHLVPMVEGFENPSVFNADWSVLNLKGDGFTFERTSLASYTGSFSVRIRNMFNDGDGEHELISPSYDLSVIPSKTLKFKQAFVTKNGSNGDKLLVLYSKDCGNSWSLLFPLLTTNILTTSSSSTSEFRPASNSEWEERVIDLTRIGPEKNVRFKFQFHEGGGSNLYLDDINIGNATVGFDDFNNIASFNVYPNPTESSAQISFNLLKDVDQLSIKVKNAIGQEVTSVVAGQAFNKGKYTLRIDEQRKLSSGIYFVEFTADNNVKVQKLVVQ